MKLLPILGGILFLAPVSLLAQTKPAVKKPAAPAVNTAAPAAADKPIILTPVAAPAPAATPATAPAATTISAIPLAPVTPAADPNALKIRVDMNPIAHKLTVRCEAKGPTRIEINDKEGRPVLTRNTLVGTTPVVLNTASLPAGPYVVRCIAGDKKGTKLVQIN